jgi:hypothetical protein
MNDYAISSIQRVQNYALMEQYKQTRSKLAAEHKTSVELESELYLFHGSGKTDPLQLAKESSGRLSFLPFNLSLACYSHCQSGFTLSSSSGVNQRIAEKELEGSSPNICR